MSKNKRLTKNIFEKNNRKIVEKIEVKELSIETKNLDT